MRKRKRAKKRKSGEISHPDAEDASAQRTNSKIANDTEDTDSRTPAEKAFDEKRRKLEEREIKKIANKTYRQRVEEFNQYVSKLSEHYDIPKVGPG